tara:strand:- start:13578 stop:15560 length:1983 start_codon:yes stop_codon:yes gene_type:complete
MIMTTEKMVYVKSNDYWGYDASEFDNDANFYTYTWTVPESMYNAMDADNQAKLFPCALFYVQGVTDNHNFLTLSIDVDGANAKVRGMQGAKRRTLKFESGVPYAYSVGSLTMKAAPAGSDSVATIESEVLSGVAATDGTFNVSSFLTDASDIASAVGLATASAAESYASETEVSDFYPQSSAEIGSEQSGRGVPVSYGSGSSQYVEPPVVELSAEVSDFYPQSSAEIGDEQSGRGVPVSYGSGSSQYVEPPVVELSAEVSDFYPQSSAEIGDEQSGRGVPVSYGSGSSQYVEPPVLELGAEVIDDNYMDVYSAQGYNDKMDESLGMRDGAARKFRQSMKDRRNEAGAMDRKYGMRRKYEDVETMDAETASFGAMPSFTEDPAYLNHKTNDFERTDVTGAVMWRGKLMPCMWCGDKSRMIFGSRSDPMFVCESRECLNSLGIKNNTFDGMSPLQINSAESFGADMIYEGLPVIPDSYGTNSALSSGQGVPVWYGSAESPMNNKSVGPKNYIYNKDNELEEEEKYILSGKESRANRDRLNQIKLERKRLNQIYLDAEGDDYSYEGTAGDIDIPIPADAGETNPMEFVELGAYDVPVIPNTVGTDSAGGSGYGVPQWYGADTFDADRMSTSLEESAPPKMGKKVGVVALIGLGLGAWMASRKN